MSDSASTCKHCGQRIVLTVYALGPKWDHQPEGAAFQDNTSRYCEMTCAEPIEATS